MDLNPAEQKVFNLLSSLKSQQDQPAQPVRQKQAAQPKKKGNFFTNLLPTAGSILGGVVGSIAAPGVGTAAGGATGGILGKKLQDMLTGNHSSLGSYGAEAGYGALGGIGKAYKAIRGGAGALRAGEGAGQAASILRN